jgi:peptide/nickel transport system substrate-binding protein
MRTNLFAAVAAVALWGGATAQAADLRVAYSSDIVTLDPANHRSRVTESVLLNIYDAMVARTDDMKLVDEIAESMTQIDATTWEAKLRKGIFHDGSSLTAEDVKFTFDRLTKRARWTARPARARACSARSSESRSSTHTVRFTSREPWPILPAMLPFQEVVSKAFVEARRRGHGDQVNGTGPFKLVEWRAATRSSWSASTATTAARPRSRRPARRKVDRVIFRVIPENASRVAALLAGEVDIINELPGHAIRAGRGCRARR